MGLMRSAPTLALVVAALATGCGTERVTADDVAHAPASVEATVPARDPADTGGVRDELMEAVTGTGMNPLSDSSADHGKCATGVLAGPARDAEELDVAGLVGRLESAGWAEDGWSEDASLTRVLLTKNGWTLRVRDYSALGEGPGGPGALLMLAATKDACTQS